MSQAHIDSMALQSEADSEQSVQELKMADMSLSALVTVSDIMVDTARLTLPQILDALNALPKTDSAGPSALKVLQHTKDQMAAAQAMLTSAANQLEAHFRASPPVCAATEPERHSADTLSLNCFAMQGKEEQEQNGSSTTQPLETYSHQAYCASTAHSQECQRDVHKSRAKQQHNPVASAVAVTTKPLRWIAAQLTKPMTHGQLERKLANDASKCSSQDNMDDHNEPWLLQTELDEVYVEPPLPNKQHLHPGRQHVAEPLFVPLEDFLKQKSTA